MEWLTRGVWLAVGNAILALLLGVLGLGCSQMIGEGATVEDQLKVYRGFAEIAKEYNLSGQISAHLGGSPEGYAKTSFGVDTTLSGQATLSFVADDPSVDGDAEPR